MPVVGIVLGVAIASEPIDLRMIAGAVPVIGGVALTNARYGQRRLFGRREIARSEAG